ncbi:nucleotidyl transferase AbiEii/AbiGii toxin family protein [Vibrio navarrensis]|uniref:nucleotidyl transferase AbiEii/AbiGii toxin family protein n=1 Tax=Vibrio navarrensis TaxID=29495 RepID=UPI001D056C38|nr:nucleotidyl transferase AbiEii/AbiGii toxin family protein [Vibrio navarrensis]
MGVADQIVASRFSSIDLSNKAHDCFALKGGTAINLFVRDFPRLSVDIDLVFLPMMERNESLQTIKSNLDTLASTITANIDNSRVVRSFLDKSDALRLLVERDGVQPIPLLQIDRWFR